jgi:dynein heavy chain
VETAMPGETPICFGLHPNAEIGFRLQKADSLFKNIQELQPRSAGSGGAGMSLQDVAKQRLDEMVEKLPDMIDYNEIVDRLAADGGDRTPYTSVFLQEIERMNILLKGIKLSLLELDLGLKGDLQISDAMMGLMYALFEDRVFKNWADLAYPSARMLSSWFLNLLERVKQLQDWSGDLQLPKCTQISNLFNPQSFITAVMQTTARANSWPLDRLVTATEVTRFTKEQMNAQKSAVSEGAAVTGFLLEGARWDDKAGNLDDSKPKELFQELPVVIIKSVTVDKAETKDVYLCPCYKTQIRGPNYVFTAILKTKAPARKWIIGGVALILDIVPI